MKRLHKAVISFGIVAVLVAGSSSVFARSVGSRERLISGPIVRIDRSTRTITVREHATGNEVLVVVPADRTVRTNLAGFSVMHLEQLTVGMFITDVRVR